MEETAKKITIATVTGKDASVTVYYLTDRNAFKNPTEYETYMTTHLDAASVSLSIHPVHRVVPNRGSVAMKQYNIDVMKKEQVALAAAISEKEAEMGK